jgi:hypothetical protein
MSLGSFLSSFIGSVVAQVAPQTGPALAATLTTVTTGHLSDLGHAVDGLVNAIGADTETSTILHGVASTVTNLANTGLSNVLEPIATGLLSGVTSTVAAAIETPLQLLAPHTGPTVASLLTAVGTGNVATIGHSLNSVVTAAGNDITQSTILHGVASAVTSLVSAAGDTFHFAAPNAGGTDALAGIMSGVTAASAHANDLSSGVSATHIDISHIDVPITAHDPLADLAHAAHHA